MKKNVTIYIKDKKYHRRINSVILFLVGKTKFLVICAFILSILAFSTIVGLNEYVSLKARELTKISSKVASLESKSEEIFASIDSKKELTKLNSDILDVKTFGLGEYGIGGGALSDEISRIEKLNIRLGVYNNLTDNIIYSKKLNNNKKSSILKELAGKPSVKPAEGYLGSRYGYRIHPITHTKKFHQGIDISGPAGTDVVAASDGVVVNCRYSKSFGNVIKIKHKTADDEYETVYAHLDKILTVAGVKVKKGEIIGKMGSTGRSTGSHLHYEVVKNGVLVDPIQYFYPEDHIVD